MFPARPEDLDYDLPADRIAQHPPPERDAGRLLCLPRREGQVAHATVRDLPELLPPRSLLVVNDVRVEAVRLRGRRPTGGRVEVLVVEEWHGGFEALVTASRRLRVGDEVLLPGDTRIRVEAIGSDGRVRFAGDARRAIESWGEVPLPPYVRRAPEPEDRDRYQTIYAREPGAAAAPTAGLHLSQTLLDALGRAGHSMATVWLAVGPGTFRPVRVPRLEEHRMEAERYRVPEETARAIADARRAGRPVVAVGTTVVRTLEAAADDGGVPRPGEGRTSLFIRPPFEFRAVDALLTNFHLPRSTLIALVAAFAGTERVLAAYREAVETGYRFYSYGDAMLVW